MQIKRDLLSKILYSTDASPYREIPEGVCYPENKSDLISLVKDAAQRGFTLIPRAGGTSLAGQVVGNGLVVDISRHFNKILEINTSEGWARVEPGVVLDQLNRAASQFSLFFGPETSTSNRCCMAGMVGNNSCGSHSLVYGSTRDHLLEAEVILSDGSLAVFKDLTKDEFNEKQQLSSLEGDIYRFMGGLLGDNRFLKEVDENFPDKGVRRRNCGYALDEFTDSSFNLCKILAGSEGTLAFITELKLKLVPVPPVHKGLLCAHCSSVQSAFEANIVALKFSPAAVEMIDANILELSKSNISQNKNRFFIQGDPAAILVVEFVSESETELRQLITAASEALDGSGFVYHSTSVFGKDTARVWELRKAGLGLLTSMAGDTKPVSVIEDTAVAPERLPGYMRDISEMLDNHSLSCVFHAHIGTGELHLRPLLNLKKGEDVELFRKIAVETALIVKKHRGSLSGEHGDGRLRGEFIPIMYGEYLYGVMKQLKRVFDPGSLFNTGKITDTPPMNSSLRYVPDVAVREYNTFFDFSAQGGWIRAIEQCNGSGDCRKAVEFGGTMCPSFRVTGDELHSTRGRSNVLREFLTNSKGLSAFKQREIVDALDLCISCKACKSECPSSVDMTRHKAEFMQHYYDAKGYSFRSFMISRMAQVQMIGSVFPSIYNYFASSSVFSSVLKGLLRFSAERSIPRLSRFTLRSYAKRHSPMGSDKKVYLFADEFTNYNEAEVGVAFIELMEALGYCVIVPEHYESGRAALSKGMLRRAKRLAEKNVVALKNIISADTPLVGIEPSAILSFSDEYPDLVSASLKGEARQLADNCLLFDQFIMREFEAGRIDASKFTDAPLNIILHGHCHQKSLASVKPSAQMLSIPVNYRVKELETGCCGMAGSFGYEKEHYSYSVQIGEQLLFPAVRAASSDTVISAPGTSCRQQIFDGTGRVAKHPVVILREAVICN